MLSTLAIAVAAVAAPSAVELTIYNGGFALVKETRTLPLRPGTQEVAIEDVAQMIEANSVSIRSRQGAGRFSVLEQNYQYDLVSPLAILNKAVGGRIILNRVLPNGQKERIEGTLISSPTSMVSDGNGNQSFTWNGMVVRTDAGAILLNPSGEIEVSSLPSELRSKPTLVWLLESAVSGEEPVELSYLTQGMSWKSDYVLALEADGKQGDIRGWVTLTNNSGTSFNNAKLKLLAGEVFRAPRGVGGRGASLAAPAARSMDAEQFAQEAFADYHLYTLQRPATVRNRELKQVSLLEGQGVQVTRRLVLDIASQFGMRRPQEGSFGSGPMKPSIFIDLMNTRQNKLGMPMPMGTFKVFQRDSSGSLQLLGEQNIDHTPRDEKITLALGRAFDVVVEKKRTKFEWIGSANNRSGSRETFVVELRNRKDVADTVEVIDRFWGQYKVLSESQASTRLDNETLQWRVSLNANETKTLTYVIETRW